MKLKTKGKCPKCEKMFDAAHAGAHLLACTLQSDASEGYLIRISWAEQPGMYWIFATIPKNTSLSQLDAFLRDRWLECCDHLSEFTIAGRRYVSHSASGNPSQSMKKQIDQFLSPGSTCQYVYDMGSSTELEIQVVAKANTSQQKKIMVLMQNESPAFSCESCKKSASIICSQCGDTTCSSCSKKHTCVMDEGDDYMLMPLVNSPRAGVCGYEGP